MMVAPTGLSPLLAHQYGWDEIAMFLVPIALAIAGVRFAEKRAAERKRNAEANGEEPITPEAEQPTP